MKTIFTLTAVFLLSTHFMYSQTEETIELSSEEIEFYQLLIEQPFEHVSTTASESMLGQDNLQFATISHILRIDRFMSLETKIRFTYKNNKFVELKSITSNLTGLTFGFN